MIRPRATVSTLATLLLLALGVAACGSDDNAGQPTAAGSPADATTPSQTATPGACPLEAAALSSAINLEMTRTTSARCGFVAASPKPGQVVEVYYTPIDAMVFDGSEGEQVSGIADAARWDTQMAGSLLVKTGSRYFSVQAVAMGDLPENLRAKNLASTVARMILSGS